MSWKNLNGGIQWSVHIVWQIAQKQLGSVVKCISQSRSISPWGKIVLRGSPTWPVSHINVKKVFFPEHSTYRIIPKQWAQLVQCHSRKMIQSKRFLWRKRPNPPFSWRLAARIQLVKVVLEGDELHELRMLQSLPHNCEEHEVCRQCRHFTV